MKKSVAGIIYTENKFLVGHRLSIGEMGNRWEFIGGKVDGSETPEEALKREFMEETGIMVTVVEKLTSVNFNNRNGPVELIAFSVNIPENTSFALSEHSEIKWLSLSEVEKLDFVDSDRLLFPFLQKWIK